MMFPGSVLLHASGRRYKSDRDNGSYDDKDLYISYVHAYVYCVIRDAEETGLIEK